MSDFNPSQRNSQDFLHPVKVAVSWLAKFISILFGVERIRGVDLSHWNGDVDFVAMRASGIDFVILKVTEGITWVDDKFAEYWIKALDAGLLVMTYHFFRSNFDGIEQAKHHIDSIQDFLLVSGYKTPIIWFDVETEDGATIAQRRQRLLSALDYSVEEGYQAGVYSSPYLWEKLIGNVSWINDFLGWVAHWIDATKPSLPVGWVDENTIAWQEGIYPAHKWVELIGGIDGNVDANYYFGTRKDLEDRLGVPVMDCCDELKEEIARLEKMIDANTKGRHKHWNRLNKIEELIQEIRAIFCKEE